MNATTKPAAPMARTEIPGAEHLPAPVKERGLTESQWRTLKNNLYPGAHNDSILMVVDYCRARKLDPLKKPCHIVPMMVKDAQTGEKAFRDVVMPGIYEIRTTAQRTGEYLGHAQPTYGDAVTFAGVEAPAWCEFTVYRWNSKAGIRAEFPVRTRFDEVVALKNGVANDRWSKAPFQMLTKCAEAAALRAAFPDELGGEATVEEMEGRDFIDGQAVPVSAKAGVQQPQRKSEAQPAAAPDSVDANGAPARPDADFVAAMETAEAKLNEGAKA